MSNYEYLGKFQSTLPREERRILNLPKQSLFRYFNPRSHERSDQGETIMHLIFCISIHAPTRGATTQENNMGRKIYISIHAPTRGATILILLIYIMRCISIHAPTRGATDSTYCAACRYLFQSTLPREERRNHSHMHSHKG